MRDEPVMVEPVSEFLTPAAAETMLPGVARVFARILRKTCGCASNCFGYPGAREHSESCPEHLARVWEGVSQEHERRGDERELLQEVWVSFNGNRLPIRLPVALDATIAETAPWKGFRCKRVTGKVAWVWHIPQDSWLPGLGDEVTFTFWPTHPDGVEDQAALGSMRVVHIVKGRDTVDVCLWQPEPWYAEVEQKPDLASR